MGDAMLRKGISQIAVATWVALLAPVAAHATPATYDLNFETNNQSLWGPGSAIQFDQKKFLGFEWQNKTVELDLIIGDNNTRLPTPEYAAYLTAFGACTLLHSASVCTNGQTGQVFVPALGSRPSVRSCGTFDFGCQAARLVDITRRAAYDTAFTACDIGFSASVCRNGQPLRLPVPALGTGPTTKFVSVDTRTGVGVTGHTDGRAGIELGLKFDSGSVNAKLAYQATLDVPNTAGADKAIPINFNPNSLLRNTSSLNTTFSNAVLTADAVLQLSGSVDGTACFVTQGCITGSLPFNEDKTAPILSFNVDGNGGIKLFGKDPSFFGFNNIANAFPAAFPVAGGLGTVIVHLPRPDAAGGLNNVTQKIVASGQDDLLDLLVDLDGVVSFGAGVPGLFGRSFRVATGAEVGYDIINVNVGPQIDLKQDFELDPTLFVTLDFDKDVMIAGQIVRRWTARWDLLPEITFLDDVTTVTPTFFVEADLRNRTLLDFDLGIIVDLLQINYDVIGIGKGSLGVGNVLNTGVDLFNSPDLYNNRFPLEGFPLQVGNPFVIDFTNGSQPPSGSMARTEINQIVLPGDVSLAIPVPGSLVLILAGLIAIGASRRATRPSAADRRATMRGLA